MRILILAGSVAAAALLAGQPAQAADSFGGAPAIFDWSGFYVGLHAGGAGSRVGWTYVASGNTANHNGSGAFGGVQLGFNSQSGNFVFGAEADLAFAGISGATACPNPAFSCRSNINWLGSARARVGYAFDRAMIYATGGLGFGGVRIETINVTTVGQHRGMLGWTLGGGAEFALGKNWSVKAEYAYYDFGRANFTVDSGFQVSARPQIHTGKIGVNFRW